jgi:hypothetical protein
MAPVIVPEVPVLAAHFSVPDTAMIGLLMDQPVDASNQTFCADVVRVVEEAEPKDVPDRTTVADGVDASEVE